MKLPIPNSLPKSYPQKDWIGLRLTVFLALLLILLVLLAACNLSTSNLPPTLVPRVTDTPLPPITYATLSPTQLPQSSIVPGPSINANLRDLLNQIEPDRLIMHVDALQNMGTRHVNSADQPNSGIRAAYRYVLAQFQAIQQQSNGNFLVFDRSFPLTWAGLETVQNNVFGWIQGTVTGGGIILVGAHYDSVSIDPNDASYAAPGANDDGSGIAALIEMARILSVTHPRATIMFVAFGAEEVGRQGSIAFVNYLLQPDINIHIDAMLNMDIIGSQTGPNGEVDDKHLRVFSVGPNDFSPSRHLARSVDLIAKEMQTPLDIMIQDADSGDRTGRYSDHLSFSDAGFSAIRFIESLEDKARQHTPRDTIDDVQVSYLVASTQTIMTSLVSLADGLPPPVNISLRDNGDGTRALVWETVPGAASYVVALRHPGALSYESDGIFAWNSNTVPSWNGFVSTQFTGLVICSVDANGLIGPPSREVLIP